MSGLGLGGGETRYVCSTVTAVPLHVHWLTDLHRLPCHTSAVAAVAEPVVWDGWEEANSLQHTHTHIHRVHVHVYVLVCTYMYMLYVLLNLIAT